MALNFSTVRQKGGNAFCSVPGELRSPAVWGWQTPGETQCWGVDSVLPGAHPRS